MDEQPERRFVILKYMRVTPSLATCDRCHLKFFTPLDVIRDPLTPSRTCAASSRVIPACQCLSRRVEPARTQRTRGQQGYRCKAEIGITDMFHWIHRRSIPSVEPNYTD